MDYEKEATELAHKLGFVSHSLNWWAIKEALQKAAQQAGAVDGGDSPASQASATPEPPFGQSADGKPARHH